MAHEFVEPNPWMVLPFVALLALIALGPLAFPSWWGRHYPKVALALAAVSLGYYLFAFSGAEGLVARERLLHTGIEYIGFIALIGSLFVVSGGIHINVKGEATPLVNVTFLLIGAILANVLGTTGASMLLIRPWIRMNKYRITAYHIVFFIFIISNVAGCLTPIGDPPLFLGYLKGIPFWWVAQHCWPMWLVGVGLLLAIFFVLDSLNYRRAPETVRERETAREQWRFDGASNVVFLAMILGAVFVSKPLFLREGLMLAAAAGSYLTTRKSVHAANHFNFHPIQEVAVLFIGIFATMIPALDWLQLHAAQLGLTTPSIFYWGCGSLSSVLDNAPTYLAFLSAIFGQFIDPVIIDQVRHLIQTQGADLSAVAGPHAEQIRQTYAALNQYHGDVLAAGRITTTEQIEIAFLLGNATFNNFVVAISIAAVFFGAFTYIGNGPNFMVKAIAEHQKVHTPTFLGYIFKYSLVYLFPVLLLVWLLFFRN